MLQGGGPRPRLGIDAVYQDLALVNQLTVYHNMFLEPGERSAGRC